MVKAGRLEVVAFVGDNILDFPALSQAARNARQAKEALCERAEELAGSTDWGATGAAFRDLLTQWKAAGRAAKDVDDALWQRFRDVSWAEFENVYDITTNFGR